MANKVKAADRFANIAYLTVTESAANTLTFAQLAMATPMVGDKYGLIIHRAEIGFSGWGSFNSSTDQVNMALTLTDRLTDITDLSQPELLFYQQLIRMDLGAAATGMFIDQPYLRDFANLPNGGLLVPGDRLYAAIVGTGMAAATVLKMRLYYSVLMLEVQDYWELVEARRLMTT